MSETSILLIHPPVSKPCEPPAGIAKLSGALRHHGIRHDLLDANLEGLLSLLKTPLSSPDTWTSRAFRHLPRHLDALRDLNTYRHDDRYRRSIKDLNRLLDVAAGPHGARLGLANYEHKELSPVRSRDLLMAAEHPEENPFYPYFKNRLTELITKEEHYRCRILSQLLKSGPMHVRNNRFSQAGVSRDKNRRGRRARDFVDQEARMAESVWRPCGPPRGRTGRRTSAFAHGCNGFRGGKSL